MPRVRKGAARTTGSTDNTATQETAPQDSNGNNATVTTNTGERKMAGLSAEQIAALLSNTRTKGMYTAHLETFLASGEGGVCANDEWADVAGKKAATVKQGFNNAIEGKNAPEGADKVKVITNEEKVYLINLAAAQVPDTAVEA